MLLLIILCGFITPNQSVNAARLYNRVLQGGVLCGPVRFATDVNSASFFPVFLPSNNSPIARWVLPGIGFIPDAYYRLTDPQFTPINPPIQTQEYGSIERDLISATAVEQISGIADCAPTPPTATPTRSIELSTTSGAPGAIVSVTGSQWYPGGQVINIFWDGAFFTETTVDDNGDFAVDFAIPADALAGNHVLTFSDGNSGFERNVPFSVIAVPTATSVPPATDTPTAPATDTPTTVSPYPPLETPTTTQVILSSISGRVVDTAGNGMADVRITVIETAGREIKEGRTVSNGEFKISELPPGVYIVIPTLEGYTFSPPVADPATVPPKVERQKFVGIPIVSPVPTVTLVATVVPTTIPTIAPTIMPTVQASRTPTNIPSTSTPKPVVSGPNRTLVPSLTTTDLATTAIASQPTITPVSDRIIVTPTNALIPDTTLIPTTSNIPFSCAGFGRCEALLTVGYQYPLEWKFDVDVLNNIWGPLDTRPMAAFAGNTMKSKGYAVSNLHNTSADELISQMKNVSVFYYVGHGTAENSQTGIALWDSSTYSFLLGGRGPFTTGSFKTGPYAGNSALPKRYVYQISSPNLRLVVINGCATGEDYKSENNLLNSFAKNGVIAIGFNVDISPTIAKFWGETFWKKVSEGIGVRKAAKDALKLASGSKLPIKMNNLVILPENGPDMILVPSPSH